MVCKKEVVPKISIIIPVYKVEQYINHCLDSFITQTFKEWECILIDDGSPDNSGKICDEYASTDSRFRVIHQKNMGVSAARNAGIKIARGSWIGFVDSDDWIDNDYLYELNIGTSQPNVDIVICNIIEEFNYKSIPIVEDYNEIASDNIEKLLLRENRAGPWAFICRKQILEDNKLIFDEDIIFWEDFLFKTTLYSCSRKLYHVSKYLYHYERINSSAATLSISSRKCLSMLNSIKNIKKNLIQYNLYDKNKDALFFVTIWTKLFYVKSLPMKQRNFETFFENYDNKSIILNKTKYFEKFNKLNLFLVKLIAKKHYYLVNLLISFNNFFKKPYTK